MMTDNYIPNQEKPEIKWNINKRIFIKENVFDEDLCEELIAFGDKHVIQGVNKYPDAFSVRFHSCLLPNNHKAHDVLQDTWKEVIDFFKINVSFIEPYELKKYGSDDFFGKHIDNYYSLSNDLDRKITMSVQLSDNKQYDDGHFKIINSVHKMNRGSVIAFPSFFPHEVEKIKSGTRWSLIGWAWGPYWR